MSASDISRSNGSAPDADDLPDPRHATRYESRIHEDAVDDGRCPPAGIYDVELRRRPHRLSGVGLATSRDGVRGGGPDNGGTGQS